MIRNLLFTMSLLASAGVCNAGLMITPVSTSPNPIVAGSSGTIDFFIRADSGTQLLDGFQASVFITGSTAGGLVFSAVQTDSHLSDPNYVFFGKSLSQNTATGIGFRDPNDITSQTYLGADSTDDGSGVQPVNPLAGNPVPVTLTTTEQLLFRLNLTGVSAGTYTITVDPNTAFYTDQLDPVSTTVGGVTLGSSQIQVIVTAVPEPGTLALIGLTATGLAFLRRKRKKEKI